METEKELPAVSLTGGELVKRGRTRKTNKMGSGTMEMILSSAKSVLVREGSERFTIERIAKEANITKGTLLYHFRNKEDMLELLMNRYVDKLEERFEDGLRKAQEVSPGIDPTVGGFSEWYKRFRKEDAGYTSFGLTILTMSVKNDELRKRLQDWYADIFARLKASPAGDNALIAVLALEGLFYLGHFRQDVLTDEDAERVIKALEDLCRLPEGKI